MAAGVIVGRISECLHDVGADAMLTDAAAAAVRLRAGYPDRLAAMEESNGGATLHEIGRPEDIAFYTAEDASDTVPVLLKGEPMQVVALTG